MIEHKYMTNHVQNDEFGLTVALSNANVEYIDNDIVFKSVPITKRGVMNDSYKPAEEAERFANVINNFGFVFPVTLQHPHNSMGIVLSEDECIGVFKNAVYNPQTTQVIADVHINNKFAEIADLIIKGFLPDVSIGYFADVEYLDDAVVYFDDVSGKVKKYDSIERNMFPNHLAVLGKNEGACSVKDGCGFGCMNATLSTDSYKIPSQLINGCGCTPVWIEPNTDSLNDTGVKDMPDDEEEIIEEVKENEIEADVPDMTWKLGDFKTCLSCGTMVTQGVEVCPTCQNKDFWTVDYEVPPTEVPGVADEFYYSPRSSEPVDKDTGVVNTMNEEENKVDVNALGEEELKENAYVKSMMEKLEEATNKLNAIEEKEVEALKVNVKELYPKLESVDEMDRAALENAIICFNALPDEAKVIKVDTDLKGAVKKEESPDSAFARVVERNKHNMG